MAANTKRNKIGINLLRAAEQEAHLIVTTSRTEKQARLKQVKEEAEKEIAEFRAQMEVDFQFQKKLLESSGESGDSDARLEQETEEKIDHLKKEALRVSADVVSMLLSHVTTVKN